MSSFNRVIIMGNLTRDPDFKQLSSGQSVCRLGLAANRQFKNRQSGQMTQEVCYVDIDVWGAQADSCFKFLTKGRPVLVEGRLKLDTWEDADGKKQSKHSIVADRVTFLTAGGAQDADEDNSSASAETRFEPVKQAASASRSAAPRAPRPAAARPAASKAPAAPLGEINFKDEEAFDDDLPF